MMSKPTLGGKFTFPSTTLSVNRIGYGAMQLAGPHVFGPPKDENTAIEVLREAIELGVNHIDTSDAYGPHITNQIIKKALHPYPKNLVIVSKVGAIRGSDASWVAASSREDITKQVHNNLRNLGLEALDVVNLRSMLSVVSPAEGSIAEPLSALFELQKQGLVKHVGLSNVTSAQVEEGRKLGKIVCVQNHYNLAHRTDDSLIDHLAHDGIAYVPFFPLGGFSPIQSSTLTDVAKRLGTTPMQVAQAWLLHRSPNILLISGTSSVVHLRENLAAENLKLSSEILSELDRLSKIKS